MKGIIAPTSPENVCKVKLLFSALFRLFSPSNVSPWNPRNEDEAKRCVLRRLALISFGSSNSSRRLGRNHVSLISVRGRFGGDFSIIVASCQTIYRTEVCITERLHSALYFSPFNANYFNYYSNVPTVSKSAFGAGMSPNPLTLVPRMEYPYFLLFIPRFAFPILTSGAQTTIGRRSIFVPKWMNKRN